MNKISFFSVKRFVSRNNTVHKSSFADQKCNCRVTTANRGENGVDYQRGKRLFPKTTVEV